MSEPIRREDCPGRPGGAAARPAATLAVVGLSLLALGLAGCAHLIQQRGGTSARGDDASSWRMKARQGKWQVSLDDRSSHRRKGKDAQDDRSAAAERADADQPAETSAHKASGHRRKVSSYDWRWSKGRRGHKRGAHRSRPQVASARAHQPQPEPAMEFEPEPAADDDDLTRRVASDSSGAGSGGEMTMSAMDLGSAASPAAAPSPVPAVHHHSKRWCRRHRRRCRAEKRRARLALRALRRKQRRERAQAIAASPVPAQTRAPAPRRTEPVVASSSHRPARLVRGEFDENGEGFLDESDADVTSSHGHRATSSRSVRATSSRSVRATSSRSARPARRPAPRNNTTVARTAPPPRRRQPVDDREGFIDDSVGHLPNEKTDSRGQVIDSEDPLK